jgi:acyl carrier protein
MKKTDFYSELKDALMIEEDEINENTEIHLTSLSTLSVIAFIDENFDKQVRASDLKSVQNISNLITLIGPENIE